MYFDWGLDEYLHNRDADRNLSDPVSGDGGRSGGDSGRHQDRAFDGGGWGDGFFGIRCILWRVSAS